MHLGADYCCRTEQASIITGLVSIAVQDHPDENGKKPERNLHEKQSEEGNGRSKTEALIIGRRCCRVTYVNPAFLLHVKGVVLGLGAIDGNSLTGRGYIISAADGRPLSILHLCECGWTRRSRGGGRERHQKSRGTEQKRGREAQENRRVGGANALKPSPVASRDVRAVIKRLRGESVL
jgi:hypothetical protein